MRTKDKELFSEQLRAGGRTYFFDVHEASNQAKYLVITESKKVGDTYEHNRVFVFQEHISAFQGAFGKATEFLSKSSAA